MTRLKIGFLFLFAMTILPANALGEALVRSASGDDPTDLDSTIDTFRSDIGGGSTAGTDGSFGSPVLRREINWDGVMDGSAAPNLLSADFFNTTSPRGVVFSTPGSGFQVSATAASGVPVRFGNLNAAYSATFQAFSEERLFTAVGSNVVDVDFFVPGTTQAATVTAFGAVFADVDSASATSMEMFDVNGDSLGAFRVPAASGVGSLSFIGVSFDSGERIARVRMTLGSAVLSASTIDDSGSDLVVLDDFIYSEPEVLPAVGSPTVAAPNGGEGLLIGSATTISWTPAFTGGNVKIELSRNGGSTFETIFESTADDGSESWTVTGIATSQALVRITSLDDVTKSDQSDASFSIVAPKSDLSATLSSLSIRNGRTIRGSITILNGGQAAAGPFTVDIYASSDERLTRGDVLIRRIMLPSLASGNTFPRNFRGRIPTSRRQQNVIAIVDSANQEAEADESNNLEVEQATP